MVSSSSHLRSVSIHAPWEGCDFFLLFFESSSEVSIRAPWEGCDYQVYLQETDDNPFQFTHPGKGATGAYQPCLQPSRSFNSRTLGRVRLSLGNGGSRIQVVSIHAPWEGCDYITVAIKAKVRQFQFTHPGKGATFADRQDQATKTFQFTHPGKGATKTYYAPKQDTFVSIHAPWEGCDTRSGDPLPRLPSFNSRTLGRVRPSRLRPTLR